MFCRIIYLIALACLDRQQRLAYILGDIFKLSGESAADILNITPVTFRKRLSRARGHLKNFMSQKCGLMNPGAPCRCSRHVVPALETGWLDPAKLMFADHPFQTPRQMQDTGLAQELDEIQRMAELFRSQPDYSAPPDFVKSLREMLDAGALSSTSN